MCFNGLTCDVFVYEQGHYMACLLAICGLIMSHLGLVA